MSECPQCGAGITPGPRKKTYCSRPCQKAAANVVTNARRAPTGKPPGRPSRTLKADRAITTVHLNSEVASTGLPGPLLGASEETSRHRVGDRVRIWIDDATIGAGERHLLVSEIGRVHVKLYSFANLAEVTVSRRDFEAHAQAYGSNPVTVLGILERNLRAYERAKLDHDRPLERAWDALRKQAAEVTP